MSKHAPRSAIFSLFFGALFLLPAGSAGAKRPAAAAAATPEARQQAWETHRKMAGESLLHGLQWRSIGPVDQGGRVVDIAGIPGAPHSFYVAYASGGVWKTTNDGTTFTPLFDRMPVTAIGALAVAADPDATLWVGTGEANSSRSSYGGHGIYRSRDGGATFEHRGLEDTDRIARIVIDPKDPRRILVAALGKLYTQGGGRGVYLSEDGGGHWERTLPGDEWTGAVDLVMNPATPSIVYAATWERRRRPWDFTEGGAGSGIWRSADGGRTWRRLAGGLPAGAEVGRIGLALAASRPATLYAALDHQGPLPEDQREAGDRPLSARRLREMDKETFIAAGLDEIEWFLRAYDIDPVWDAEKIIAALNDGTVTMDTLRRALANANRNLFEAEIRGLEIWRSDDGGDNWRRTHDEPLREVSYTYGYYFGTIRVAPDDPERIYVQGVPQITSADGGRSFHSLQQQDVHVDYHAHWIDPENPRRMIVGNDGGLDISHDGGQTWRRLDAQPVGQFYSIAVDMEDPYNVYGGLQDNGTMKGSSRTRWEKGERWTQINGGDGMHVAVDPRDSGVVYTGFQFGNYVRLDSGKRASIRPHVALGETPLRFNWNSPVVLSPHTPEIVYFGSERLFRSIDRGRNWTAISGDLSRSTERGDVPFATITTIAESPRQIGLIWAGTDDGEVWVSETAGHRWQNVAGRLPAGRWVSRVVASAHDRDRAYVSLNGYRDDDITAYLYRSDDLGHRWHSIAGGLPAEAINVVREDPFNPDVLYVGTDRSVYVSFDRGASWQALDNNLPHVPVHDLVVHPRQRELVAGTHGRSAWVVDVLPIEELTSEVRARPLHVFHIDDLQAGREWQSRPSRWLHDQDSEPRLIAHVWAASDGQAEAAIEDDEARVLQRFTLPLTRGINRLEWNLQLAVDMVRAAETGAGGKTTESADSAPAARRSAYAQAIEYGYPLYPVPGVYTLRITQGDAVAGRTWRIAPPDPWPPRRDPPPKIRGK